MNARASPSNLSRSSDPLRNRARSSSRAPQPSAATSRDRRWPFMPASISRRSTSAPRSRIGSRPDMTTRGSFTSRLSAVLNRRAPPFQWQPVVPNGIDGSPFARVACGGASQCQSEANFGAAVIDRYRPLRAKRRDGTSLDSCAGRLKRLNVSGSQKNRLPAIRRVVVRQGCENGVSQSTVSKPKSSRGVLFPRQPMDSI